MNKKLLYALIFIFLAVIIIFNIYLKKPPSIFNTGMINQEKASGVAA